MGAKRGMRILMVNKFLYPRGGSETYMFELADNLVKRGTRSVTLACMINRT